MNVPAAELNAEIAEQSQRLQRARDEVGKVIVGQRDMIDRLLMALIADGRVLARREFTCVQ